MAEYVIWDDDILLFESFNKLPRAKKEAKNRWRKQHPDSYAELFWYTTRDGHVELCVDDGVDMWASGIIIKRI